MTSTIFHFPAARLAPAQALVERFARKAARLGMPGPSLTILREYQRVWIMQPRGGSIGPYDGLPHCFVEDAIDVRATEMVEVEIAGERPVLAGWRFAAVIESTEAGNLLRKHPEHVGDLPLRFRDCASGCDHCGTDRRRSETFVVQRVEQVGDVVTAFDDYRQVGRSCLGDFTGHADPAVWLACYQWLRELEAVDGWDDGSGGYGYSAPVVCTLGFLACVAAHVRQHGYVSATVAREHETLSATGSEVWHLLTGTAPQVEAAGKALRGSVTDADRALVERALAWLGSAEAGDSEYIHNLRIHAACSCVRPRGENMLASLVQSYRRFLGDVIKRQRPEPVSEYLPGVAIKSKVGPLLVTLVHEAGYETDYGWKSLLCFEDADGRAIVWRTMGTLEVEIGTRVWISGTVKDLGLYKGRKQTELTRCSVELWAVEDDSVPACTAVHGKRATKSPAVKLKRGEQVWLREYALDPQVFAPLAERCTTVGDGYDTRDPLAAFDCAA